MNNYKCKCGNEKDFFTEHNLSQCGLYCGECGKWQKWLNKDEERLFKHKQDLADHDKQIRDEVIGEFVERVEKENINIYEQPINCVRKVAMRMKVEQNE